MNKHTMSDLYQMQGMSLEAKVDMTKRRIQQWIDEYGEDGVYVSFSGGKDSTVLFDLVRQDHPSVKGVFVDTGLEYPEIRDFVRTFDNIDWIKPKMTFKKVIEKYGYPFISKEVSERVYYAQKYLTWWNEQNSLERPTDRPTDRPAPYGILDIWGAKRQSEEWKRAIKTRVIPEWILRDAIEHSAKGTYKIKELLEPMTTADGKPTQFDFRKWKWLAFCPHYISNKCCGVMKKSPVHKYERETGRKAITAMMASESRLRTQLWLKQGCNAFDAKKPTSNPMAFWTEQDVIAYIYLNKIPICSVYGEVVKETEVPGQLDMEDIYGKELFDLGVPVLKTTGCNRTGCMFCAYGCHLEKGEGRFERMKRTHPKQYDYIMRPWEEGGLNYKEVIDWINEHGNLNIKY